MQLLQATSPNFTKGRRGRKAIAIINHITAGLMPGTLSWLRNPAAQASAHYLVTKAGDIYQLVNDEDTAWHVGIVNKPNWALYDGTNPNRYTIGIEHEALAGEALTKSQYQATLWLHRHLIQKHGLPVDRDHIIGHYRTDSVNRKNDPGPGFPWDKLFNELKGVAEDMKVGMEIHEVKVMLKGKTIERSVILNVDGRDTTYIPAIVLREIGMTVNWDETTKTVKVE